MVYTPTWKKNLILFCGLMENLIFTGNILGWSALNQMLKSEGIYNHFCIDEDFLAKSLNNSFPLIDDQDFKKILNTSIISDARAINKNFSNLENIKLTTENIKIVDNIEDKIKNNDTDSILNIKDEENDDYDTIKDDDENTSESTISITTVTVNSNKNIAKRELSLNNKNGTHEINSISSIQNKNKRKNCKKQDTILNLAYTIGTFLNGFTAFVWGFLLDKWGLRKVRLLINSFLSVGCLLLCLTSKENPHLIFPAISLLCLGGVPLRIADMQFANLVPSLRSSIITLYSGAFSASSIIFVILKYFYEHGMNFYYTTSILFLTSLLILPITFFLLPSDRIREDDTEPNKIIKKDPQNKIAFTIENTSATNQSIEDDVKFSRQKFNKFYQKHSTKIPPITLKKFQYINSPELKRKTDKISSEPVELNAKIIMNHNIECCDKLDEPLTEEIVSKAKDSEQLPLKLSLYSFPYLVHQYWFCWLITYMIMYVGSMNLWISRITEDVAKASFYLKIYGLLQVFSLILAPLAGAIMDYEVSIASKEKDPFLRRLKMTKAGFWPILLTNLSLVGVIICKFFDHEIAIYISIVLNTILRSFLVAVASAYLRIRFPAEHFNKLLGIMSTVGSLMTLLQFPLFIWESSPNNVIWVNIFNAFLTMISFTNPILLLINPIQEKIIKRQQKLESLYKS